MLHKLGVDEAPHARRKPVPATGLFGSEVDPGNLVRASVAEALGTSILVFAGTAVAVGALLSRPTAGGAYDSLAVALAFGLTLVGVGDLRALIVEALITFILVLVIVSVATDERVGSTAATSTAIGFALAVGVFIGGPITGGAVNPARALGPMIVAGKFNGFWVYLIGPVLGGILAAVLYDRFLADAAAPEADEDSSGG